MIRSIWVSAFVINAGLVVPAIAGDARFRIDIPAGDLTDALATLSSQTGASIGIAVNPAGVRSGAVRGRYGVGDALTQMLAPTPFSIQRVGPSVWRLIPRKISGRPEIAAASPPLADIVVTARKVPETLSGIATPIAVYVPRDSAVGGTKAGLSEVAAAVEGLSVTNFGVGRDRPFIRGIADSPFNGFSQATVSINVDDTRVTYDAPEPGLRLVDVARVEVLKGPQGPLYGTGALGGVYRVVTNRPVPGAFGAFAAGSLDKVSAGGLGANVSGMLNIPLFGETAAIRMVGYAATQDGWVRDAAHRGKVNDALTIGNRVSVRVLPAAGWVLDFGAMRQRIEQRDSQYVDRDAEDLVRSARLPEPSSSTFSLVNASAGGPVGSLHVTMATGQAWQNRSEIYDVTPVAAGLGDSAGRTYQDRRRHRVFDQEVRLSSAEGRRFAWTAGASYLAATTVATGTLRDQDGQLLPFVFALHRVVTEAALFADGSMSVLPKLRAGLGARVFRATTDDERSEQLGAAATARASLGVTPSGSLTYAFAEGRSVYVRFGTAFRPGGLDTSNSQTGRYDADDVRSLDVGTRLLLANGRLSLSGGAFRSSWSEIQSDYLLPSGLVSTRNAGNASILGAEVTAEWRLHDWFVRTGGTVQRSRLESTIDGTDLPKDRRLPTVPDLSARAEVGRTLRIGTRPAELRVRGTYTGRSRLSFDDGLDRSMGGYALLHAEASTTVGGVDVRLDVENLLDARADSFSLGNPFRIRTERQYTPLRPRTLTIGFARRF